MLDAITYSLSLHHFSCSTDEYEYVVVLGILEYKFHRLYACEMNRFLHQKKICPYVLFTNLVRFSGLSRIPCFDGNVFKFDDKHHFRISIPMSPLREIICTCR